MQDTNKKNLLRMFISERSSVNAAQVSALQELGIHTIADLIKHLPMRYERHHGSMTIQEAHALLGEEARMKELVTIKGVIAKVRPCRRRGKRSRVEVTLEDDSGTLHINWFNQPWVARSLHPDMHIRVHGSLSLHKEVLQLNNPRWEIIDEGEGDVFIEGDLRPVYHANEGISSTVIARLMGETLQDAIKEIDDHLPNAMLQELAMPELSTAYLLCHNPSSEDEAKHGKRRIAFDELLLLQLGVMMKRHHRQDTLRAPQLEWNNTIRNRIAARIPFPLTDAQQRVIEEIASDITTTVPMNRLLQGDVGSGKTVVALHAMLMAVTCSTQAALMAPTELLAEQHFQTFSKLLDGSKVSICLLTSSLTSSKKTTMLQSIANGEIDIVIGTHALLTESVVFKNIAIAITDEQHRFGVQQRAMLRNKADDQYTIPHTLVMTATPIPRTLSLTVFGDLDVSTINAMPPGRTPITTRLVLQADAPRVYAYLRELVDKGQQGYVVVPLIEETESGMKSVIAHAEDLKQGFLRGKTVAVVHGRMKSDEREETMQRFRNGDIDVLVATTVIEVGVDISNATMMVIEHADRFGLAQLHQLRGRVGRGKLPGVCALIANPTTQEAEQRLQAIVETTDGFEIAERDLYIRGPGEMFGAKQSGIAPFQVARLPRDFDLLRLARTRAIAWIKDDPTLKDSPLLRARLLRAHGEAFGLGDVA